jgi:hypothetical protein
MNLQVCILHSFSIADIIVNVGPRSSIVTMTVPQAVILLAYTSIDQLTIGQLAEDSGLSFEYVCSCLRALLDFKILKTEASNVSYKSNHEYLLIFVARLLHTGNRNPHQHGLWRFSYTNPFATSSSCHARSRTSQHCANATRNYPGN